MSERESSKTNESLEQRAEKLGVVLSDKNYIKALWERYCGELSEAHEEFISSEQESVLNFEEHEASRNAIPSKGMLADVLDMVNSGGEVSDEVKARQGKKWLEEQLLRLGRVEADLELSLRNNSENQIY